MTVRNSFCRANVPTMQSREQRLKNELYLAVTMANRVDEHMHNLHWVRIEEAQRRQARSPTLGRVNRLCPYFVRRLLARQRRCGARSAFTNH